MSELNLDSANILNPRVESDGLESMPLQDDTPNPMDGHESAAVDIATERTGRHCQIAAKIHLPFPAEHLWQILTDYDNLADFIPNLDRSRCLGVEGDRIRIEQVGAECLLNLKFCARVVLDMLEQHPHRIDFEMVEGDFKAFTGSWQLHPCQINDQSGTTLCYTISVLPARWMPVGLIERHLSKNLRVNLLAIQQRAIELFA